MSDDESEKFKGLDKHSLVEAPLQAAVAAQGLLASDVADFLAKVSITDTSDSIVGNWYKEVYQRNSSDVLTLGIENVPDLSSEKVNVSFDIDVKASSEDDETKKNEKF